jgi:predicted DCC family thiol-disulfide oxidoreductase YuxK
MQRLYLLYDGDCALCRRIRNWLYEQPHWLELQMLPANSEAAKQLFPSLATAGRPEELVVVTDEGHYYKGNHAWIMCLYGLTEYRDWAYRLARPLLLPLARQAFDALSHNRARISRWLRADEAEIARELEMIKPSCVMPVENKMKDYLE